MGLTNVCCACTDRLSQTCIYFRVFFQDRNSRNIAFHSIATWKSSMCSWWLDMVPFPNVTFPCCKHQYCPTKNVKSVLPLNKQRVISQWDHAIAARRGTKVRCVASQALRNTGHAREKASPRKREDDATHVRRNGITQSHSTSVLLGFRQFCRKGNCLLAVYLGFDHIISIIEALQSHQSYECRIMLFKY